MGLGFELLMAVFQRVRGYIVSHSGRIFLFCGIFFSYFVGNQSLVVVG